MKSYYIVSAQGKQIGPIPFNQLKNYGITPKTLVWCEGMPNWMEAERFPELQGTFVETPPQVPPIQEIPNLRNNQAVPQKPDTYLVWAILSTILCCLPFGVVSIVYAAKVDSLYFAERYVEANEASNKAKNWAIASICTSLGIWLLYIIVIAIAGLSDSYSSW